MKTINDEYYVLDIKEDPTYPRLQLVDNELFRDPFYDTSYVSKTSAVEYNEFIPLKFGNPIPSKPVMADFLSLWAGPVITRRFVDILEPIRISGIQLIPARIEGKSRKVIYDNYYIVHVCHTIMNAVDEEKSDYEAEMEGLLYYGIVLDEDVLAKIHFRKRLVFILEYSGIILFHETVVDEIMKLNPTGVDFVPVKEWKFKI